MLGFLTELLLLVTKPQAVSRPTTECIAATDPSVNSYKTASGNQAYNTAKSSITRTMMKVTKPQAVIRPTTTTDEKGIETMELQNRKR